jgi:hypothetical protein
VTFLDLLGFGQMIDAGIPPDEVLKMLREVRRVAHEDAETKKLVKIEYLCISDCMIRALQLENPRKVTSPELQSELLQLAHMQTELILRGYPVRGAVTHGSVYFKGRTLFGPAYQNAFRIESKVAKFPRIVADKCILTDFVGYPEGNGDSSYADADVEVKSLIRQDAADGEWFIDYIKAMESEYDYAVEYAKFLVAHANFIRRRLVENAANSERLPKYKWMENYHNSTITEFPDKFFAVVGIPRSDLIIADDATTGISNAKRC